jgi:ketosteroid isomerase-like protein
MVRHAVQVGLEAANRRDYKVAFALHHPDVECVLPAEFVSLGFEPVYRGRDARVRFQDRWQADWGGFRIEPEELFDLGDRVLVVGQMRGSGLSSRAAVVNDWAYLVAFSGGRVRHEQTFLARGEAFEATGLGE